MSKKRVVQKRSGSYGPDSAKRELIKGGFNAATKMGPIGWVAVVAIAALSLAAYAIHALVAIVMKS